LRKSIIDQGFKAIVLGVAASWNERKGLSFIQEVANKRKEWYFVIIGSTRVEQRIQMSNIVYIDRTENVNELRDWYSAADVLAQPTLEDTYPTTNLEAIACGTPVVTFPTGGSKEIVRESGWGLVTKDCTSTSLEESLVVIICDNKIMDLDSSFELDSRKNYLKYIDLYNSVYKGV
jgi:glycosyltransferase involved in cell wall biosynthesis